MGGCASAEVDNSVTSLRFPKNRDECQEADNYTAKRNVRVGNAPKFDQAKLKKFKQVYEEEGRFNFDVQVPFLSELAKHYEKRFRSTRHWADAVKAHALYNSCAVRESNEIWQNKAFEVQLQYWGGNAKCSFKNQEKITTDLKKKLNSIRLKVEDSLSHLKPAFQGREAVDVDSTTDLGRFVTTKLPGIMLSCTNNVIEFTNELIHQAVLIHSINDSAKGILQQVCVVGLGSLAREEATPYSDLEFMFLVSNKTEWSMTLFENLAVTIYFLITNLGETRLKSYDIAELAKSSQNDVGDWFMDEVTNGYKFDGLRRRAGHIPTGNAYEQHPNCYIATVDEMVNRYKSVYENPDLNSSKTGDLSTIMSGTVFLYGDKDLLTKFQKEIKQMQMNKKRQAAILAMIKNDVYEFDFKLDYSLTELKKVKNDLYRYPSLILFHLNLFFNMASTRPQLIIDDLQKTGKISKNLASSLRIVYCAAQYTRQALYSHFRSQREDMTVQLTTSSPSNGKLPWSIPPSLLSLLLMHLVPVKKQIKDSIDDLNILSEERFPSFARAQATVRYYCEDYKGFLTLINNYKWEREDKSGELKYMHIHSLIECDRHESARNELDEIFMSNVDMHMEAKLIALNAELNKRLGDFNEALKYEEKTLSMKRKIHGDINHPSIASSYNNIGSLCYKLGQYQKALKHYREAFAIQLKVYGDVDHPVIATSYNDIGLLYKELGLNDKALESYTKALSIQLKVYGDVDHPSIATSHSNIGLLYNKRGDYGKALGSCSKALSIRQNIYGDSIRPDIAMSYSNIGSVFMNQGDFKNALSSYKKSLEIDMQVYGDVNHPDIATSHNNIGSLYHKLGDYKQALENYRKALYIRFKVYSDANHPDIAAAYNNISSLYVKLGDNSLALENANKALAIQLEVYGKVDHPSKATTYDNLGLAYDNQSDYEKSFKFYTAALNIRRNIYGDIDHPDIATSYNNLGSVCKKQGNYEKALQNYDKALSLRLKAYNSSDHPNIAVSYNNIGIVYDNLGQYSKALENYNKAHDIKLKIYGNDSHPSVATSYNNIGSVYQNQGDYDRALENYEKALSILHKVYRGADHPHKTVLAQKIENIKQRT